MRCLVLLAVFIGTFLSAKGYEVEDGKQQGFTVSADNFVYITTPGGEKVQVTTNPFAGEGYSMPPVEPIRCTWDPSHTWLGIFITVKQITEIHLFDLKRKSLLNAKRDWSKYPAWFGKPQLFTHTKPVKWDGNRLFVDTLVKFKDGSARHLPEIIVVDGGAFRIVPEAAQE